MLRQELLVLGAAPGPLAPLITRAYSGPLGVTVVLANRLRAYFGDATRPHAKWLSLARVLADPSSSGATYVDLRVPERPAAGFPPGSSHAGTSGEAEPSSASDPTTAAELAAGLEAAVARRAERDHERDADRRGSAVGQLDERGSPARPRPPRKARRASGPESSAGAGGSTTEQGATGG